MISESRLKITLRPKGKESDLNGWVYIKGNGQMILGLKMAPKVLKKKLFVLWNLVIPLCSHILVVALQRVTIAQWEEETVKSER